MYPQKDLWGIDKSDIQVYLPVEIFSDFSHSPLLETIKQRSFAFSFYYLSCYLYRNCKYSYLIDMQNLTVRNLCNSMNVRYEGYVSIVKKGGILDQLGYTETHLDYPTSPIITEGELQGFRSYRSNLEEGNDLGIPTKFYTKYPVKAFYRDGDKSEGFDGTFFFNSECFKLNMKAFLLCVNTADLGLISFYIYAYLKFIYDWKTHGNKKRFAGTYKKSIATALNVGRNTIDRYIEKLEYYCLINVDHEHKRFWYSPYKIKQKK